MVKLLTHYTESQRLKKPDRLVPSNATARLSKELANALDIKDFEHAKESIIQTLRWPWLA